MITYEGQVQRELKRWQLSLFKPPGLLERTSKRVQTKVNRLIPEKVHRALTAAVKGIVQSVLIGIEFTPTSLPQVGLTLQERDQKAKQLLNRYKKVAAVEGAGTGAGGIMLGIVDFPALIAIKMKFLFELAHIYGFSTNHMHERLFILYVFQLAFSSSRYKQPLFQAVQNWEQTVQQWPLEADSHKAINWEQFQREYRDSIDFKKMLQLVPGIGAVIGAWANFTLLEELGVVGMNSYRMRLIP